MTAQATSDVNAGVAALNERPHYEKHPSGLKQIELAELLPYNLGSALKYVWRYEHKGDPAGDLEKALWHLEREIGRHPDEQSEARRYSSVRTRINDRFRPMRAFVRDKEFVAVVAFHLCEYQLSEARALVALHLKRYRSEGDP